MEEKEIKQTQEKFEELKLCIGYNTGSNLANHYENNEDVKKIVENIYQLNPHDNLAIGLFQGYEDEMKREIKKERMSAINVILNKNQDKEQDLER